MDATVEVHFVDHCEPACGLGSAEFRCPACGQWERDFDDLWWGRDELTKPLPVRCEHCQRRFIATWLEGISFLFRDAA